MKNLSPFTRMRFRPIVQAVLDQAGVRADIAEWEAHTNGSAHLVINVGDKVSVRVAKTAGAARTMERRAEVLRALPQNLPFASPRPLTRAIQRGGFTGIGLTWVPGTARPTGPAPVRTLGRALRAINRVDPEPLRPYLATSLAHGGGQDWGRTLLEDVVPLLLFGNRDKARRLVEQAQELEPVEPRLIHGDFAGHNILWQRDRVSGIIDWDHACLADPAWDIAAAGNWFGWETMTRCVGRDWAERGKVLQRLMPLQAVGYVLGSGREGAIRREAVERADAWIQAHA